MHLIYIEWHTGKDIKMDLRGISPVCVDYIHKFHNHIADFYQ